MERTRTKTERKKPRIKVSSAKAKGREFQQWVGRQISIITGYKFGKDCPIESRPMGQSGVDVRMEERVLNMFPFSVECKRQENWSVPAWIEQAARNQLPNTDWLLFMRRSRTPAVVTMDALAFFRLIGSGIRLEDNNGGDVIEIMPNGNGGYSMTICQSCVRIFESEGTISSIISDLKENIL